MSSFFAIYEFQSEKVAGEAITPRPYPFLAPYALMILSRLRPSSVRVARP